MKKTLLELVKSILSDMDSEDVNSIGDTVEAQQVASIVEDTFYNIVAVRHYPTFERLIKMTSLSDNVYPTHFEYVGNKVYWLKYNVDIDGGTSYRTIKWLDPSDFLSLNSSGSSVITVPDKVAGTSVLVRNDKMPTYYTSFDQKYLVMDAYDATIDSVLQNSKTQAFGVVLPVWTTDDTYTVPMPDILFPYLLAEAKSVCFSLLKNGSDPKVEQAARRLKSGLQNDKYTTARADQRPKYGR